MLIIPTWVFYVGVWVACALVCGTLYKNKNRDYGEGVAVGAIFGVFAVVYALFMGTKVAVPPGERPHDGMTDAECPSCHQVQKMPQDGRLYACFKCKGQMKAVKA